MRREILAGALLGGLLLAAGAGPTGCTTANDAPEETAASAGTGAAANDSDEDERRRPGSY